MSLYCHNLAAGHLALSSASVSSPKAVWHDLVSVYEMSTSDLAAEPKGQVLSDIGQSLFERQEWAAAASAYKAAAFAWIDLPGADPLWGLNPKYLQPLKKAAAALENAQRYREASQLYLCAAKPLVRVLSQSSNPAVSLQQDYDDVVARPIRKSLRHRWTVRWSCQLSP